jgi:Zn-dependent metalloprotease
MKKLTGFLLLLPFLVDAQQSNTTNNPSDNRAYLAVKAQEKQTAAASFQPVAIPYVDIPIAERVKLYFKQNTASLQQPFTDIELTQNKHSRLGWHYSYQQTYKGIPVHGATLKVNVNEKGVTLSVFDQLVNTQDWVAETFAPDAKLGKALWIASGDQPIAAYQSSAGYYRIITDTKGMLIHQKDERLYYATEDTMVTGKVFKQDPLTIQSVIYGQDGTYKHFNDSDYSLLNDAREDVSFPATIEAGIFKLKNQYAIIIDRESPVILPVVSPTPVFDFTRKQSGFKDVMALYHVYNTQMYFQHLGFDELENFQIKIDAHSGTSDNSAFVYNIDSSLNFGTGGVPDAEDGDVICHEYTHAMSWFLNAAPNMSTERRAMEEGMCDVIAAIMSKRSTEFNWRKLFNFDGPNPTTAGAGSFWGGRNGNSSKKYSNKVGDWYSDSEIWSSTLLDISEEIGSDSAVILMFTMISSLGETATMPQAAQLFMQADSILFDKYFGWKMGRIFNDRELGNFPTALDEQAALQQSLKFSNTAAFAMGEGNAILELPVNAAISVYDIQGKLISNFNAKAGNVSFDCNMFTSGMYIINVKTDNARVSLKLIRN